jgi:peroxiredoxin Q/BCP
MCTKQFCSYRDDAGKLAALDAVVIGVSPQDLDSHQAFTAKHSLTVPLLTDPGMEVARAYGVAGGGFTRRSTFIIDPDGVIRARKTHKIGLSFEDADWISEQLAAARGQ